MRRTEWEYLKERPLLTEVLEKADRDVKIGSEFGYTYWFIGSVDEFLKQKSFFDKKYRRSFVPTCRYVEKYIPIMKRRVADVFYADSLVDDTLVIVVEGNEKGSMWLKGDREK